MRRHIGKKLLISFIWALVFSTAHNSDLLINNTTPKNLSSAAYAADYLDSFTEEFSTIKDTFSNSMDERKNSIKNEIKDSKKNKKTKDKKSTEASPEDTTNLDIKSDTLEYFPERQEVEAVGHASITLPNDGSTLRADRLVLNQETGILKGFGNVRLIKGSNVMDGDSITIHLKEKNALLDNPIAENMIISLKAESAKVIAGKDILVENGIATSKQDQMYTFSSGNFANYGTHHIAEAKRAFYLKEKYNDKYTIDAKEIIIDAKAEHDTITARNADIYLKDMKIASSGKIKIITNKEQQYVETNIPEIGFVRQIGLFAGPGAAFEAPFGGALKVIPFFNAYQGKVGVGGMGRYRNDKNLTEFAISSVDEAKTVLRGQQEFTDNFKIQYGANGYMDEWFLGDRVAGKTVEAIYKKDYRVEDLGLTFSHRISTGIMQDFNSHWSTTRTRWMGNADKPIWYYGDDVNNRYGVFELATQGAAAVYGNGDTVGLLRFGPRLRTETDRWIQAIGYFYTSKHGDSPFRYDQYRYGRNNIYIREGIKMNKYLSLLWSGSFALSQDTLNHRLLQENRFFVMVGPDDMKFILGYDTVRQRTVFNCLFILGTQNAELKYKKLYIKNPDKIGVSQHETKLAEKAHLEAKAEIKPSLKDRIFHKTKDPNIEPEQEDQLLIEDENINPAINRTPAHEIIVPQVKERREIPETGISASRWTSGRFRLHDKTITPMLTPMIMPGQNNY